MFTEEQRRMLFEKGLLSPQKTYHEVKFNEETIRAIFGHEAAEDEDIERLKRYYVKTEIYNAIKSTIPLYILVGHKGVGKSALFKILEAEDTEECKLAITIQPDDILDIETKEEDFLQRIRDWKEGLSKIIFRELILSLNNYVTDPISNKTMKDWVKNVTNLLGNMFGKQLAELQNTYLDITNAQIVALFKNSLFKEKTVTVYLDDLDRGWKNSKSDVANLSAMLNAIRDLSRDTKNLKFRVALRSDVYYSIRTSDETTDKIDGSVLWLKWTNHEILVMLIKRIETYFGNQFDEEVLLNSKQKEFAGSLNSVFEREFRGKGHWEHAPMYRVLTSLIRKRPRDLVKLCTLAARRACNKNHNKIMTEDLENIFANYSNDRLTDTGNEYQSEFPKVKELLLKMKPSRQEIQEGHPCKYTRAELIKKINNILSMSNFTFKEGIQATPEALAAFMYKINFITARKKVGDEICRVYYDENQYIYNDFTDFGYDYEIHPAYRWALQPDDISVLFKQIELLET
ncbi:MAG: hypothetical protein J6A77_02760 [Lachnospiraceae bacterium]|nr:hypothetical protein [Lachnospiraceae bacterium]